MSRVIKFRAWDSEENKMIYTDNSGLVLFMLRNIGDGIDAEEAVPDNSEDGFYRKKLEHLQYMQFTGLQDKYGNFDEETENQDIYENDIILDCISGKYFEVIFEGSCGCYLFLEVGTNDGLTYEEFEDISSFWVVYGNRFEHPHLLEGR